MKRVSLMLMLAAVVMAVGGCKKSEDVKKRFDSEYGHAKITINLQGTLKDFVKVNVIADDVVLDVITPEKPTVEVEFAIKESTELRTEAVLDETYELPLVVNMKFDATYDIQVMRDGNVLATNNAGYSYKYNYQTSVQTAADTAGVYTLCHTDLDRRFTLTKSEIIAPKK